MANPIESVFSQLGTILRYIASGFVAVVFVHLAKVDVPPLVHHLTPELQLWGIVVAASLLGFSIYAVSSNVIVPLVFWRIVVCLHKKVHKGLIPEEHRKDSVKELMHALGNQRWVRRAQKGGAAKHIQVELDKWGASMSFLYCSSYPMIVIALWKGIAERQCTIGFWGIMGTGVFLLLCAVISDYLLTEKELRVWLEYPVQAE